MQRAKPEFSAGSWLPTTTLPTRPAVPLQVGFSVGKEKPPLDLKKISSRYFLLMILFIYLFVKEREREGGRHRQREKQARCREPDVGLDARTPGSCPKPMSGTKPLSHPRIP